MKLSDLTTSLSVAGLIGLSLLAQAAEVPAGIALAEKQELVRNSGSEPASLDPHKSESNLEFKLY